MIASAGTILLPLLALVDDVSCVTVTMLSSMGEASPPPFMALDELILPS
jgi:hypothetical protein